ncbi:PREDICTED: alanine aminotransferase 1-like [Pseudopodoces humilis]|uniref:alanine aminotransferase 1-like n=1 Tax=Pseudopodoces humilis TaxID=181119 RepID=UPI0006B71E3E|nr:PREDICTED: alanine aminotransferase 1-like [Pseudopodoces humilis]
MDSGNIGGYNHEHRSHGVPGRISRFLEFRDGFPCDPGNIILCSGTATMIPFVLSLFSLPPPALPAGVLVPVPGPPVLREAALLAGAVPVPYALSEPRGWVPDEAGLLRELRGARGRCRPRVLCVVNPGDPTGQVLSPELLAGLARLAAAEGLLLLGHEVRE